MREFRHERAFWTAGEALRTSWRSYDLHIIRAKAGVEMDLYASVRQDVARALKIRPQSPDALRTLAEALRRCVRTVRALRASAGVSKGLPPRQPGRSRVSKVRLFLFPYGQFH